MQLRLGKAQKVVECLLLQIGQQLSRPAEARDARRIAIGLRLQRPRRIPLHVQMKLIEREPDLLEIVLALRSAVPTRGPTAPPAAAAPPARR